MDVNHCWEDDCELSWKSSSMVHVYKLQGEHEVEIVVVEMEEFVEKNVKSDYHE